MDWQTKCSKIVIPDPSIFCNSPWYELQIYWDGSLGFCCAEDHKIYPAEQASRYNVREMTLKEWFNSEPMRLARSSMFGKNKNSFCHRCYVEEDHGVSSRRHRCNQKSVIFTRSAFTQSFQQSPGLHKFEHARDNQGDHGGMPIDLHIDLGNYCNLACKMCFPEASSVIAAQYVKWQIPGAQQYVRNDWTRDTEVWEKVISEIADISNLSNVHFMGGETLITKKFEQFVDYMISRGRTDLNFSFVTNGTMFNESLLNKLKNFRRVGIEVSIETMDDRNAYQRQGTDNKLVMSNIQRYLTYCNGTSVTVAIRPAISALTIGTYTSMLEFCLTNQLVIKSNLVIHPRYLDARILPDDICEIYLGNYSKLLEKFNLNDKDIGTDYNESDPNQIQKIIKNQIEQCRAVLTSPRLSDSDYLIAELVSWCRRWDDIYGYDARQIYPELRSMFDLHGY